MLGFASCPSNAIEATVKRVYYVTAEEESFNIYEGESSSGTLLLSVQGTTSDNYLTKYYSICMIPDQLYYIEYIDSVSSSSSSNYGWSSGSYVEISYQDNVFVKGAVPSGYNHRTDNIFVYHPCSSNEIQATVTRQYTSNADEEYFTIYPTDSPYNWLNYSRNEY